jgi:hypothetical protein
MPKSLMNPDLVERVVRSYEELIADTLRRPERGKFKHISILCLQVRDLLEWNVTTVADADGAMEDAGALQVTRGGAAPRAGRIDIGNGVGLIQQGMGMHLNDPIADTVRAVVGAMQPAVDVLTEKNRLTRDDGRLDKLQTLLDIRERLKDADRATEVIDRQIDAALAALEEEAVHADHDVVRSKFFRRHPAGADAQRDLPPHRREVDGAGDAGAHEPSTDGGEEGVDQGRAEPHGRAGHGA